MDNISYIKWKHYRSSHRRCFLRKHILRNFAKFTGEHLCQSLFLNKAAGLHRRRSWHKCFPVNFAKFLRTPSLQNTSGQLLLNLPLRCWFSETAVHWCFLVLEKFAILVSLFLIIKLQTLFYRTSTVAAAANTFLQLNMVFTNDSRTGFWSGLLWKQELNLRNSHWSGSVKKVFLENLQISQENTCVEVFLIELQTFRPVFLFKRDSNTDVLLRNLRNF